MNRSDSIANLVTALAKAQAAMKNPVEDSINPHFRSRYASLAAVRDAVMPALTTHGLSLTQWITTLPDAVQCETTLWHETGEYLSETLRLPVDKPTSQSYGGGATYAKRIALMGLCVVAGDQDDDGQSTPAVPTMTTPEQKAKQEWVDKLQTLMLAHEATQEEIERFWRYVAHKYGDALSPSLGEKLYGELQVRFAKKKQAAPAEDTPEVDAQTGEVLDTPRAPASVPAGQAGVTYIAQIEAAVHASGGGIAQFWTWAERHLGKSQPAFSVSDYVGLLKEVRTRDSQPAVSGVTDGEGR